MAYNGVTIGMPTVFGIIEVDGMDLPPVQSGDQQRARDHGEFIGLDMMAGRDITITGDFVAGTGLTMEQTGYFLSTSITNWVWGGSTELPLWFQWPSFPVLCAMARPRKRTVNVDLQYTLGLGNFALSFHATDPRFYSQGKAITSTGVGGPAPGGNPITINFLGNTDMRPQLTLKGPLTTPTVGNGVWGITLNRNLASTDVMVIDLDLHLVTLNGAAARATIASSSVWPSYTNNIPGLFYSGGVSTIGVSSADSGPTVGSTLTVTYADAYLI